MERLFLFETGDENLEELLECRHCQIFPAIVINCHLLDLGVLLYQLLLLRFQRLFPFAFVLFFIFFVKYRTCSCPIVVVSISHVIHCFITGEYLELVLQKISAVVAKIFCKIQRRTWFQIVQHFNCKPNIFHFKRQIVGSLTLGTPVLKNRESM